MLATSQERVAVILDGEYLKKILSRTLSRFPTHSDVMGEVERMLTEPTLQGLRLYRIFYHTAEPLTGITTHPLDGSRIDFAATRVYSRNARLIDKLELEPDVAVRRGVLVHQGWEIGRAAVTQLLSKSKATVDAEDIRPKILQKGVDMRIGLDIASLALKRLVPTIVVASGDSDLVPAFKLARTEGLRVYLDPLGRRHVRRDLKAHADRVL